MGAHGRGRPTRRGLQEIRYMGVRQGARVGGFRLLLVPVGFRSVGAGRLVPLPGAMGLHWNRTPVTE